MENTTFERAFQSAAHSERPRRPARPCTGAPVVLSGPGVDALLRPSRLSSSGDIGMEQAVLLLLVITVLVSVALACTTVIRKVRRDRREALILARRPMIAGLLGSIDLAAMSSGFGRIARDHDMQLNLTVVLDDAWPRFDESQRARVRYAVGAGGLADVLARQLRARSAVKRATAALLVGQLQLAGASEVLAPLLADGDGDVRLVAVRSLAAVADDRAVRVLVASLMAGHLEHERIIERLAARWAVPGVIDAIAAGAGDQKARASLARALGLAGDPSAEATLRAMLRSGAVEEQISAARALGTAGSPASAPELRSALVSPEWPVRGQAARSLGLLGVGSAVPMLEGLLGDQAWWVRFAAAEALVLLGEPGHAALRRALESRDRYARQRAQEALALHRLTGGA